MQLYLLLHCSLFLLDFQFCGLSWKFYHRFCQLYSMFLNGKFFGWSMPFFACYHWIWFSVFPHIFLMLMLWNFPLDLVICSQVYSEHDTSKMPLELGSALSIEREPVGDPEIRVQALESLYLISLQVKLITYSSSFPHIVHIKSIAHVSLAMNEFKSHPWQELAKGS